MPTKVIDQKKTRRGGLYWKKDPKKPYVSVTAFLNIIAKPFLMTWFGKLIYWAMVEDPSLSQQEALDVPNQKGKEARARGTTVHSLVEVYKHTKKHVEGVPEPYRKFIEAFRDWMEEYNVEILERERTVYSDKYNYAGTLDLLVRNRNTGMTSIVDVKTGKNIYPEVFLQLVAYKQALAEEGVAINGTSAVLLKVNDKGEPTGKFQYETGSAPLLVVLAAKILFLWKNPDIAELIKIYRKGGTK